MSEPVGKTATSIRDAVRESVASVGPRTRDAVVEHFAKIEADKQASALIKGLDKLTEQEREFNKINRPDIIAYDEDGKESSSAWSKDRIEARKKIVEQIEKLTKAINKADDNGDFGDLYNLTK